jgi:hypothetical protein
MEADAFAAQWWTDHGHPPLCTPALDHQTTEQDIAGSSTAVTTWYTDGTFSYSDCHISVNPVEYEGINDPDRFVRRAAWVRLGIVLLHERGHELALTGGPGTADEEHALGGIMSWRADLIKPPAALVEWAIAKTSEVT